MCSSDLGQYAYRDRRVKKRNFRALWIQRINAAVRAHGLTYSRFMSGLAGAGIDLDRKVLADIAMHEGEAFKGIIAQAKKAHQEATDEATRKMWADMLASYEQNRNEMQLGDNSNPALAHNRALVKKYENELSAYAAELAKYTDNEEEAQKAVEQWQKK